MRHTIVIDGDRFSDYDGFVDELNRGLLALIGGPPWDGDSFLDRGPSGS